MPLEKLYLIHHSHTDIGFTHEQPVALDLHAQFIDQAIDECERTADFPEGSALKWTCEVAYPVIYWLRRRPDRQIERFVALAKAGRIEVAGMFAGMSQCMSHEALYRQFHPAEMLRRDYGLKIRTALQCDINGQHWGLVEALLECGFDSFGMAINENVGRAAFQKQRPNGFYWQGASGRKILTWNGLHYNNNQYFGIPEDSERSVREVRELSAFSDWLAKRNYPYPFALFQVTCNTFNDNGPVSPKLAGFVRNWNAEGRTPRMEIVTLSEFFDRLRREPADRLPVHRGEWTDYWNFGAASTAYETALNRRTYHRLSEAEMTLAFLGEDRASKRKNDLNESWENAFLWDEHTWGANTSSPNPFGQAARSQLNHKLHYAYQARSLSQMVRFEAIEAVASSLQTKKKGLFVFNPLPWERTEPVEFPGDWMTRNAVETISHVQYLDRNEGSEQRGLVAAATVLTRPLKVPSLGYRFFPFDDIVATPSKLKKRSLLTAENEWLKIALDSKRGGLKGFFDKRRQKEWVDRRSEYSLGGYVHETVPPSKRKGVKYEGRMAIFREADWTHFMGYGGWNADWPAQRRGISKITENRRVDLPGGVRLIQKCQAPGTRGVEYEITLLDNQPWADLRVTIDKTWDTTPEACYLAFPLAMTDAQPRYQTAGGRVRPHLDQLPQCNQDFHTAQEWVDFSNDQFGFTLTTVDAPIVMFGGFNLAKLYDGPRGKINPLILSMAMTNYYHVNYAGGQLGRVDFNYRLYPHDRFDVTEANRIGREAAHPLVCHPVNEPNGSKPLAESWLKIGHPGISLLAVKLAEAGQGVVIRLFNHLDKPCTTTISFPTRIPQEAWLCDQLEKRTEKCRLDVGKLTLTFPPRSATLVQLSFGESSCKLLATHSKSKTQVL